MILDKKLIMALLATGISANTFAAEDSDSPDHVDSRRDTLKLSEIVVVGYGKMRRKDVTSSITTIQSTDLNQGVYTSPAQLLQGKVPGLTVSNSGDPNAAPSITLRGASTLRTGAAMEPYYIVDGVPGVDLSLVATDDI